MGNSEAKPRAPSYGHASTAPPSWKNPMGSSEANPRASSDGHASAAPPSSMNPMDGSGARPRASPIAPASSDRYIPPRSRNLASSGTGETMKPDYPRRPGVADCTYYLKFGTCGYGMQCWFNHPDLHSTGGGQSQASIPSEHNNKQIVGVPKEILELKQDIDVEPSRNDSNVSSIQRGNLSDRDRVLMKVKSILDKLTPEKFNLVKNQLIQAGITRDDILEDVINVMFEKAVSEPTFCPMYAQLCSYLNKKRTAPHSEEPDGKEIAFSSALLDNCHEVFEGAGNLPSEIDRLTGLDQEMETHNKEIMLMKLRTIGNIHLIGALLKQKIVIEKIRHHTVQMDENKQGKPDWDTFATKVFCDICTNEVLDGNRPTGHLNDIGYKNLYAKFNEKTKNGYNQEQFRSKCESLKKDYQTWKTLMESANDEGQDDKINTISASPEPSVKKMEAMLDCSKFHSAPLENVDLLNIMFEDMLDSSSTKPEANLGANTTIVSEHGAGDGNDIGIIGKTLNEQSKEAMQQKASNEEPNSTKPKTSCVHAELNPLVNSDENVNPRNSATSTRADRVGSNISEIMELVVDAGVEEGSDEHFIATQLFVRPEYREMFLTLKTPLGRLGWLKKMCQVKE
ncbi:unnamed protein product [Alopecurus aequalis]